MTFVPNQMPRSGMNTVTRTVLFWVLMIALAVVLWKMSESNNPARTSEPVSSLSYSDFMAQVDKNNVSSARLLESPSTTEVEGQLRDPHEKFRTTIPKEVIAALTEQLRKQGVPIEVSEEKNRLPESMIFEIVLLIAAFGLWSYQAKRRRPGSGPNPPAASPTPTIPTNRPLG